MTAVVDQNDFKMKNLYKSGHKRKKVQRNIPIKNDACLLWQCQLTTANQFYLIAVVRINCLHDTIVYFTSALTRLPSWSFPKLNGQLNSCITSTKQILFSL